MIVGALLEDEEKMTGQGSTDSSIPINPGSQKTIGDLLNKEPDKQLVINPELEATIADLARQGYGRQPGIIDKTASAYAPRIKKYLNKERLHDWEKKELKKILAMLKSRGIVYSKQQKGYNDFKEALDKAGPSFSERVQFDVYEFIKYIGGCVTTDAKMEIDKTRFGAALKAFKEAKESGNNEVKPPTLPTYRISFLSESLKLKVSENKTYVIGEAKVEGEEESPYMTLSVNPRLYANLMAVVEVFSKFEPNTNTVSLINIETRPYWGIEALLNSALRLNKTIELTCGELVLWKDIFIRNRKDTGAETYITIPSNGNGDVECEEVLEKLKIGLGENLDYNNQTLKVKVSDKPPSNGPSVYHGGIHIKSKNNGGEPVSSSNNVYYIRPTR